MNAWRDVFAAITRDPRYQRNLDWGEPRSGHPAGSIRAHIEEVDRNVEALRTKLSEADYWRLRVLVHTHDTFKGESLPGVPIADPRSHASLARASAEFCDDADLLAMVQYHDEPYALWRQYQTKGRFSPARLDALLAAIQDWDLFLAFNIADGCTAGKSREPLRWWLERISERVESRFSAADLL